MVSRRMMYAVLPAALAAAVAAAVVWRPGPARDPRAGPGQASANTSARSTAASYISQHQGLRPGECSAAQLPVTHWSEAANPSTLDTNFYSVTVDVKNRGHGCTFVVPHQLRVRTGGGATQLVPLSDEGTRRYRIPHGAHKQIQLLAVWPFAPKGAPQPVAWKCERPVRDVTGVTIGTGPAALSVGPLSYPWELCRVPVSAEMYLTPPPSG